MSDLDFSALGDDQLLGLVRGALQECVRRGSGVEAAARAAVIEEAERASIAQAAADREAAKLRALERERIAAEAAAAVRQKYETDKTAVERDRQLATARQAAAELRQREAADRVWLKRAAALVDKPAESIAICYLKTNYGVRVYINAEPSRYCRDHLVSWTADNNTIKTTAGLVGKKLALVEFCAEFLAAFRAEGSKFLLGSEVSKWEC